ncbi:hypothetical protein V6N13_061830 [Hibiscus sabdariffa]
MASDCNTEEVKRRLHKWGLGDLLVKCMGGRRFLIDVNDEELLSLLEKHQWSLLKEIFLDFCCWSEAFKIHVRSNWVEVVGLPLHCWNYMTFKRIAESWGSLVALGENLNQVQGCEKMMLLISKNRMKKIEEVIEMVVGNESYQVLVFGIYIIKVPPSSLLGKKDDRKFCEELVAISSKNF